MITEARGLVAAWLMWVVAAWVTLFVCLGRAEGGQIQSAHPPLPPAEAARILRDGPSLANRTFIVAPPAMPFRQAPPIVVPAPPPAAPRVVLRPLNCCSTYVIPNPYPRIDVHIVK